MINALIGNNQKERDKIYKKLFKESEVYDILDEPRIDEILEKIQSVSLFEIENKILIRDPLENIEEKDFIKILPIIVKSKKNIIFEIPHALAPIKKAIEKNGGEVVELAISTKEKSSFLIADAYMAGNKKDALVALFWEEKNGSKAEEVHGKMLWAVKTLVSVDILNKNKKEKFNINPYVFSKAVKNLNQIKNRNIFNEYNNLIHVYHDAHIGRADFFILLEQFILKSL